MTAKAWPTPTINRYMLATLIFMLTAATYARSDDRHDVDGAFPQPGVIFTDLLPDVPGKRLTVFKLEFDPSAEQVTFPHRHPGSVYVYVTQGSVRFGIEGDPVQQLHVGESFFEPAGVLHTVAENASTTELASVIAVMILPDGAPAVTVGE